MFIENIGEQEQCSIRRVNEKSKVERCVKKAETMKLLKEYAKKFGIREVIDDYGKHRRTREHSIVFPNGWVASIAAYGHPEKGKYSVAMCDYNGYFDWSILNSYGADNGVLFCNTELEIIIACETIRRL